MPAPLVYPEDWAGAAAAGPADAGTPCKTAAVIVHVPSDKVEPPPPAAHRRSCSPGKGIAIAQLVLAILALLTEFSPSLVLGWMWPKVQDLTMGYGVLCFLRLPAIVFLILVAVKLCKYNKGTDIAALVVGIVGMLFTIVPIALIINDGRGEREMLFRIMMYQVRAVAIANLTFQVVGGLTLGIVSLIVGGAEAAAGPASVVADDPSDTAGPPSPTAAMRGSPAKGMIAIAQLVLAILALLANIIALVGGLSSSYDVVKATHWVGNSDVPIYTNWWGACTPGGPFGPFCYEWPSVHNKVPAMGCGALSFILAIVFLVLVAFKLCEYKKGIDIAALVVGIVGMLITIVPIGLINAIVPVGLDGPLHYGPGYAAAAACLTFQVVGGLVLGIVSLVLSNRGAALSNRGAALLNRGAALSHA